MMNKIVTLMLLAALAGCNTPVQPGATCKAQWENYASNKTWGTAFGGVLGGALSGTEPNCTDQEVKA